MAEPNDTEHGIREDLPPTPIALPVGANALATDAAQSVPQPGREPGAPRWFGVADRLLLVLVITLAVLLGSFAATNSDLWLHLATGRLIHAGQLTFGVDPFSLASKASAGHDAVPWIDHSWLTSLLMHEMYVLFGGAALVALKAFAFGAIVVLLYLIRTAETSRWLQVMCLTLAALALSPRFLLQPMVVSYLLLAVTLCVLHAAGLFLSAADAATRGRRRVLWVLPPLFALWVNLDEWFVLGPIVLMLAALAMGSLRLLGQPRPVPTRTLLAVLGVGLLACLLNPFHVRALVLPPELGYVLHALYLPVPDALGAGGRVLAEVRRTAPGLSIGWSPVSGAYLVSAWGPRSATGAAFYLLGLLSLVSFVIAAVVRLRPGAPTLHAGRLVIWLFFALLALVDFRLIGLFALVAAPLTALNLSEFLRWQQELTPPAARRGLAAPLARVAGGVFLLLLLALAWPGWLSYIPADNPFGAPRRVAWEVRPDPSLRAAAERLGELRQHGETGHVFNFAPEFASYCAYFAPEVSCVLDARWPLMAADVRPYLKARAALAERGGRAEDWREFVAPRGVDRVVYHTTVSSDRAWEQAMPWWQRPGEWAPRYGDLRTLVFAWSGPGKHWPPGTREQALRRRAFGAVPLTARPPADGPGPEPEPPSWWELTLHGTPPTAVQTGQSRLLADYFQWSNQSWKGDALRAAFFATVASAAALTATTPGSADVADLAGRFFVHIVPKGEQASFEQAHMDPPDFGPPAAAVLAVRLARQATAAEPRDPAAQEALAEAYLALTQQEAYWSRRFPGAARGLRAMLRHVQRVTALRRAVELSPERPDLHDRLARMYLDQQYVDVGVEHLRLAEALLRPMTPEARQRAGYSDKAYESLQEQVRRGEADLDRRRADYDLKTAAASPLEQYRHAIAYPYRVLDRQNRAGVVPGGRGLAGLALKVLREIPLKDLKPLERQEVMMRLLTLQLELGYPATVAAELPQFESELGPRALQYRALSAGALGEYDRLMKALETPDRDYAEQAMRHAQVAVACSTRLADLTWQPLLGRHLSASVLAPSYFNEAVTAGQVLALRYDTRTLLALTALEQGDTERARRILRQTLDEAGPQLPFSDRPIAERVLQLLDEQR